MLKIILAVIGGDLKLAMRRQADIVSALFFFVIVMLLRAGSSDALWLLLFTFTLPGSTLPSVLTTNCSTTRPGIPADFMTAGYWSSRKAWR